MGLIKLGPLLGVESEETYTVCLLSETPLEKPVVVFGTEGSPGKDAEMKQVTENSAGIFYRAELPISVPDMTIRYHYTIFNSGNAISETFRFWVPPKNWPWSFAFASCNGFSSESVRKACESPSALWDHLRGTLDQNENPLCLLVMGGDQVYADSIFDGKQGPLNDWSGMSLKDQLKQKVSPTLSQSIQRFYDELYPQRWGVPRSSMAYVLASVPSVMMWDDHDIFDGYGSHPTNLQNCEVIQEVYRAARGAFLTYQLRGRSQDSYWMQQADAQSPLSFTLLFRGSSFLMIDNRTERTRDQIMATPHWSAFKQELLKVDSKENLFLIIGIPPVYRKMTRISEILEGTPFREELEDDVLDHWSAARHEGEKLKLLKNLEILDRSHPTIILSGDVHVGGVGVIKAGHHVVAHQIISSGIMHPAPGFFAWSGLLAATGDADEEVQGIRTLLIPAAGMSTPFIRARNYCTIEVRPNESGESRIRWIAEHTSVTPTYAAQGTP